MFTKVTKMYQKDILAQVHLRVHLAQQQLKSPPAHPTQEGKSSPTRLVQRPTTLRQEQGFANPLKWMAFGYIMIFPHALFPYVFLCFPFGYIMKCEEHNPL